MRLTIKLGGAVLALVVGAGCSDSKDWVCVTKGKSMFSQSTSGKIAGAGKACSCGQIRSHQKSEFGYVDEGALKSDFGC